MVSNRDENFIGELREELNNTPIELKEEKVFELTTRGNYFSQPNKTRKERREEKRKNKGR